MTYSYTRYNDVENIKRSCCFAHILRYFHDDTPKCKEYDISHPTILGYPNYFHKFNILLFINNLCIYYLDAGLNVENNTKVSFPIFFIPCCIPLGALNASPFLKDLHSSPSKNSPIPSTA